MSRTKKIAILAIIAMVLTLMPAALFAADGDKLAGADRIGTAIAIADAGWTTAGTVVLAPADQTNLVDALAAAPLAGQENAPILLTFKGSLNASVKAKIAALGATKVYVVGAIADSVVAEVEAMNGVTAEKLAGANRWATADAINAKLTSPAGTFVVGYNAIADALSVASYAAANKYAIVLTKADGTVDHSKLVGSKTYLVGGTAVVKDHAGATRLSGADRFATNAAVAAGLSFSTDKVYVAGGLNANLVDALAVAPLAAKAKAFVALANGNSVAASITGSEAIAVGGVVTEAARAAVLSGDLAVVSVSAINPKQVQIVFNKALDKKSAETESNYVVNAAAAIGTDLMDHASANATLQADGKTVVLTLENDEALAKDTTKNYVEVSKNLKGADGITLGTAYTNAKVACADSTLPTLVSIVQLASNQIKLTFSEPVGDNDASPSTFAPDEVTIDSGSIPVTAISADYKTRTLTLTTATIPDGDHTVKVKSNALKDFAGYGITEQVKVFTAVTDNSVPTVSVKEATADKVTLSFSKKVKIANDDNIAFRAVYNNTTNQLLAATAAAAGTVYGANSVDVIGGGLFTDELTLDFTTELPPGSVNIYIEYVSTTNTTDVIKDGYDVTLPEQSVVVNITTDTTKPTVSSIKGENATTVDVTFSEEVEAASAQTLANYTITDPDGDPVSVTGAVLQTGNKVVRLTTATLEGGTYTIKIKDVKDVAVPTKNKMEAVTMTFAADDAKNPTVKSAGIVDGDGSTTKDKLIIKFSEAMATSGAGSIGEKINYTYSVDNGTNYVNLATKDTLTVAADGKSVTIEFNANVTWDGTPANNIVKFGAITDLAGNRLGSATQIGYTKTCETAVVKIVSGELTARNKVKLVFDSVLQTIEADDFILANDNTGAALGASYDLAVDSHTVADGKSTVVFTIETNVGYDGKVTNELAIETEATAGNVNTKTADGIKLINNFASTDNFSVTPVKGNQLADKIAPATATTDAVTTYDADADGKLDHVFVEFQEAMRSSDLNTSTFTVAGYEVLAVRTDSAANIGDLKAAITEDGATTAGDRASNGDAGNGIFIVITVKEKDFTDTDVTPDVTRAGAVNDANGNAFTGMSSATASKDKALPVLLSADATVGSTALVLTFSEAVWGGTAAAGAALALDDFVYTDAGVDGATDVNAIAANSGGVETITLTLNAAAVAGDIGENIAVKTVAAASAWDANGNAVSTADKAIQ